MTRQLLTRSVPIKVDNTQIQFREGWVRKCLTRVAPRSQKPPFCHFSIARKVGKVVATCRQPQHAEELGQLAEQHPEALYVARLSSWCNLSSTIPPLVHGIAGWDLAQQAWRDWPGQFYSLQWNGLTANQLMSMFFSWENSCDNRKSCDKRWQGFAALKASMSCSTMQELPPSRPG